MKKTMNSKAIILLVIFSGWSVVFSQSPGNKGSVAPKPSAPAAQLKPNIPSTEAKKPAANNKQRDGIVYERRLNNEAARRKVESNFGNKATKPYIGKTTENRFDARKAEHAKKLGVSRKDLDMKVVAQKADRKAVRAVEQGIIRKRGGVESLANKRNSVDPKKWESHTNRLRQERQREMQMRERMIRERRPF